MESKLSTPEQQIVARFESMRQRTSETLRELLPLDASMPLLGELALIDFELRWRAFNRRFAKDQPPQFSDSLALLTEAGFLVACRDTLLAEAFYTVSLFGSEQDVAAFLAPLNDRQQTALLKIQQSAEWERNVGKASPRSTAIEIDYHDLVFERMIGRGSSGRVYEARWSRQPTKIAVKALYRKLQHDPLAMAMFDHEAAVLQRCVHPNIVGCFGWGRFPAGGRFLALEYVVGGTLEQAILQNTMDPVQRRNLFLKISAAVEHAHQIGVIHCDLKPQNILLTESGDVRIADFGLAQLVEDEFATFRGGTVGYMPPEQLGADHFRQPATDIYALGGILCFAATGREPTAGTLLGLSEDSEITTIIRRCREVDPAQRYPSVAALISAIAATNPAAF